MSGLPELFTIGVYGSTEERFFGALQDAGIDTFCDVRRRRGVRGSEYAYVNATRLQQELERLGIRYLHFLDLSPTDAVRKAQDAVDQATHTAKRKREVLGEWFVRAYRESCLAGFDSTAFVEALGSETKRAVLFCVEREPAACHRSLLAERLEQDLGVRVTHLLP